MISAPPCKLILCASSYAKEEPALCYPWLDRKIALINPKLIIPNGNCQFVKVRYYGLFSRRCRARLAALQATLRQPNS